MRPPHQTLPQRPRSSGEPAELPKNLRAVHNFLGLVTQDDRSRKLRTPVTMNRRRRLLRFLLVTTVIVATTATAREQSGPLIAGTRPTRRADRILVVRGVLSVFSLGLDKLACELTQRGYRVDVTPPALATTAAKAIARECHEDRSQGRLVVVGHSRGGKYCSIVPGMWREHGLAVALVVILDGNVRIPVPDNVERCVNLYTSNQLGSIHGGPVSATGTRTELFNIDITRVSRPHRVPPVNHFNIDDSTWIHKLVIEEVDRVLGGGHATVHHD